MIEFFSQWWCRHFHDKVFRPVRGQYKCAVCLRTWAVPWEARPCELNGKQVQAVEADLETCST